MNELTITMWAFGGILLVMSILFGKAKDHRMASALAFVSSAAFFAGVVPIFLGMLEA